MITFHCTLKRINYWALQKCDPSRSTLLFVIYLFLVANVQVDCEGDLKVNRCYFEQIYSTIPKGFSDSICSANAVLTVTVEQPNRPCNAIEIYGPPLTNFSHFTSVGQFVTNWKVVFSLIGLYFFYSEMKNKWDS